MGNSPRVGVVAEQTQDTDDGETVSPCTLRPSAKAAEQETAAEAADKEAAEHAHLLVPSFSLLSTCSTNTTMSSMTASMRYSSSSESEDGSSDDSDDDEDDDETDEEEEESEEHEEEDAIAAEEASYEAPGAQSEPEPASARFPFLAPAGEAEKENAVVEAEAGPLLTPWKKAEHARVIWVGNVRSSMHREGLRESFRVAIDSFADNVKITRVNMQVRRKHTYNSATVFLNRAVPLVKLRAALHAVAKQRKLKVKKCRNAKHERLMKQEREAAAAARHATQAGKAALTFVQRHSFPPNVSPLEFDKFVYQLQIDAIPMPVIDVDQLPAAAKVVAPPVPAPAAQTTAADL